MHPFLKVPLSLAMALVPAMVLAQSAQSPSPAESAGMPESVRVQPRGRTFMPNSSEDDTVQRRLTNSNAAQAADDAMFDRKLSICRRC